MGDRRRETGGWKQEAGDRRWETGDVGQEMGDRRWEARYRRQETEKGSLTSYLNNLELII